MIVGLVCLGPDRPGLRGEAAGLDGFAAQAWWRELVGRAECLAGRAGEIRWVVVFLVDHCPVVACLVGRHPGGEFPVGHRLVVLFLVGHCPVGACLVGRWVADSRVGRGELAALSAGGNPVGDWRVVDSLGFPDNAMADGRREGGWRRAGDSWAGDNPSCRRIRDSGRNRVVVGGSSRQVGDSRRPRLHPMGRDCSRHRDPIPIPSLPSPRAGCWR